MSTTSSESGGISKLIIKSYADNTFASEMEHFEASINPEDIHIVRDIHYHVSMTPGMPGMLYYSASAPRVLTFKLLFDDTGIIPDAPEGGVEGQLSYLRKVISDLQGDSYSPSYIRVIWGVIDFKGRLAHLETTYTRFSAEGTPIRAKVFVSILEEVDTVTPSSSNNQGPGAVPPGATPPGAVPPVTTPSVTTDSTLDPTTDSTLDPTTDSTLDPTTGDATDPDAVDQVASGSNDQVDGEDGSGTTAEEDITSEQAEEGSDTQESGEKETTEDDQTTDGEEGTVSEKAADGKNTGIADTGVQEVTAGDDLVSVTNNALGNPELAPGIAALNGLDSLRGLTPGIALLVPLSAAALLAALGKKALDHLKKGYEMLKEKVLEAKDKAKEKAEAAKDKAEEKAEVAKDKAEEKAEEAKEGAEENTETGSEAIN